MVFICYVTDERGTIQRITHGGVITISFVIIYIFHYFTFYLIRRVNMHKTMVKHEQKIGTNKITYYRSTPDSPHQIFISNKVFGEHHMYLTDEQLKDLTKFLCLRVSELDK